MKTAAPGPMRIRTNQKRKAIASTTRKASARMKTKSDD
jgi:hypothetical protein